MAELAQVVSNDRGRFLETTPLFRQLVGRRDADLQAMGWEDLVHPEDWVVISACKARVLADERGVGDEVMLRVLRPEGSALWVHLCMERGINDAGFATMTARLQPFTDLFPETEHRGVEMLLAALASARSDREIIFDSLEDCRSRTVRMAGAFVAMAGVAREREGEPSSDTRDRLNRTMAGAQAIAESVQGEMPHLERRPAKN